MEAEQAESCTGMEQSRADEIRAKQRKSEEIRTEKIRAEQLCHGW